MRYSTVQRGQIDRAKASAPVIEWALKKDHREWFVAGCRDHPIFLGHDHSIPHQVIN